LNQKIVSKLPWSARFIAKWFRLLSTDSLLAFRRYTLKNEAGLTREGETLTLRLRSPLNCSITIREKGSDISTFHEVIGEQVYRPVVDLIKSCKFVVDLGGNIGLAALYFAGHYPDAKIFTVEPNESSHRLLSHNLNSLVAAGRCEVLKAGVWSHETQLGGGMLAPDRFSAFQIQEISDSASTDNSIRGLPLPAILEASGFPRVDLLKIDIEGAEVKVFDGNLDWLDRVGAIAIEFHDDSRAESDFDNIMKHHGFRLVDAGSHTVMALR